MRAEVALPVDQRVAQREVLRHAHQRVVDRRVAVRVVLAEHVADDGRALLVRAAGHEARLVHRVEDAAVHRLQPVAHVGERALHDDAHRVVEEGLAHLVLDQAREHARGGGVTVAGKSSPFSGVSGGVMSSDIQAVSGSVGCKAAGAGGGGPG